MNFSRRFLFVAALLLLAAVSAAYLPYVGKGFKQDDFGWIAASRARQGADWAALLTRNTGFYRPVVAVTFALDELAFGMSPLGYGLTNLALLLACLFAIAGLARTLGLLPGAALAAGAIWALNFQGINMAVVWTSGRTALLLVLFAVLAAHAFIRSAGSGLPFGFARGRQAGTMAAAALFTLLALLSKEEAVMLPILLFVWAGLIADGVLRDPGSGVGGAGIGRDDHLFRSPIPDPDTPTNAPWFSVRRAVRTAWPLAVPLIVYAALRHFSGAFGPLSAPSYYRMTFAPLTVAENALKYLDFAATTPAVALLLGSMLAWSTPRPSRSESRIVLLGLVWLVAGYAITVFLPIRSPLYACFPAVGAALAAAALLGAAWSRSTAAARLRLAVAGLVLPFLLLPVYWARNVRHAKGAQLSAQLLHDLEAARPEIPVDHVLILLDDPRLDRSERLPAAFGTLYDIAVRDTLGRPVRTWIEPPPDGWQLAGLRPPDPATPKVVFALRNGHLVRLKNEQ